MHGHKMFPQDEEWETCTDLKCPCDDLILSRDEIDQLDNVVAAYPIMVEFTHTADGVMGDVDFIWEWDHLDAGWNDRRTAEKAAMWYMRGAERKPRFVRRDDPQFSSNRKSE